jgi:Binding-protein-dependent transport system inner membrane component
MGERRDSPMTLNGLTRREFLKVARLASASVLGIAGCGGSSGGVGAKGMEEAAMVDGATRFQTFWRVALPLTAPGIVTTAILCPVFSWNDYAFAVTLQARTARLLLWPPRS